MNVAANVTPEIIRTTFNGVRKEHHDIFTKCAVAEALFVAAGYRFKVGVTKFWDRTKHEDTGGVLPPFVTDFIRAFGQATNVDDLLAKYPDGLKFEVDVPTEYYLLSP